MHGNTGEPNFSAQEAVNKDKPHKNLSYPVGSIPTPYKELRKDWYCKRYRNRGEPKVKRRKKAVLTTT